MRKSKATTEDLNLLRLRLSSIQPGSSHQAHQAPTQSDIFSPADHSNALDPQRSLVVGNRGVGKSFWSAVLTHDSARNAVIADYPGLHLDRIIGVLGFHEAAGKDDGPAPSADVLSSLLQSGNQPEEIWKGVLLRAILPELNHTIPAVNLSDTIRWRRDNLEDSEALFRSADQHFKRQGKIFLIVFDALDRMGRDWATITPLTQGVLRLALDMRGFSCMKAKIFMRTDQSNDETLFRFADASKIRADSVKLQWMQDELFGLMYKILGVDTDHASALARLAGSREHEGLLSEIAENEEMQRELFYRIAGEFMGAGVKRGRTYNWIVDHLSDAFGDTSPRSFLTALQRAAATKPAPVDTVIDHFGIRSGVQDASRVRLEQLQEDYDWISTVMSALEGLEVPCDPAIFKNRWIERSTVSRIRRAAEASSSLLPLELGKFEAEAEDGLLTALSNIGVVEFRDEFRINMPDIFRVAAQIKRRGGVRPPARGKK